MLEAFTIGTAVLALAISGLTAWLTLLRRGTVRMTQPTVVYFGPDGGRPPTRAPLPKVFLRTLLYSTAERGQILESMFVVLRRQTKATTFGIWVYGDQSLARGSGLYVGKGGVSCNHHFLLRDGTQYAFSRGEYTLEVYAHSVAERSSRRLWKLTVQVSDDSAAALATGNAGVYFDWNPDTSTFDQHVDIRPELPPLPSWLGPSAS